jgi:hypothetical protein
MDEMTKAVSTSNGKLADTLIHRMNEAAFRKNAGISTPEYEEETEVIYASLYKSLPMDRQSDINDIIKQRLKQDSKEVQAIKRYKENIAANRAAGLEVIYHGLTGTKLITVDEPQEEK